MYRCYRGLDKAHVCEAVDSGLIPCRLFSKALSLRNRLLPSLNGNVAGKFFVTFQSLFRDRIINIGYI